MDRRIEWLPHRLYKALFTAWETVPIDAETRGECI